MSRVTPHGGRRAVVTLAALAVAVCPASAAGAGGSALERFERQADPLAKPDLGPRWRGFAAQYALTQKRSIIVRGEAIAGGGCAFDTPTTVATAARPVQEARERAVNKTSCLMLMEIGVPPQSEIDADAVAARNAAAAETGTQADSESPGETRDYMAEPASPAIVETGSDVDTDSPADTQCLKDPRYCEPMTSDATTASVTFTGNHKSWLEDPIGIDVTKVWTFVTATFEPGLYGCMEGHSGWADDFWYGTSFWEKVGSNTRAGHDCAHAWASTYASYKNEPFCDILLPNPPGINYRTTRSIYDRNVVRAYLGGRVVQGNVRHVKKGGCAFMLSFKQRTRRGTTKE